MKNLYGAENGDTPDQAVRIFRELVRLAEEKDQLEIYIRLPLAWAILAQLDNSAIPQSKVGAIRTE